MKSRFIRIKISVYHQLKHLVGTECLQDLKKASCADIIVMDDLYGTPIFRV